MIGDPREAGAAYIPTPPVGAQVIACKVPRAEPNTPMYLATGARRSELR